MAPDALTFKYPEVDEALLEEVVRRILNVGEPTKIVLFGSHARGTARPDSDLDLLIIEPVPQSARHKRIGEYYHALADLHPDKEIVLSTPQEIADWSTASLAFLTTAMREGRVLYERGR